MLPGNPRDISTILDGLVGDGMLEIEAKRGVFVLDGCNVRRNGQRWTRRAAFLLDTETMRLLGLCRRTGDKITTLNLQSACGHLGSTVASPSGLLGSGIAGLCQVRPSFLSLIPLLTCNVASLNCSNGLLFLIPNATLMRGIILMSLSATPTECLALDLFSLGGYEAFDMYLWLKLLGDISAGWDGHGMGREWQKFHKSLDLILMATASLVFSVTR